MDLGLTDRVYIVADAGAGLGRACAEQLAAEGARLVLAGPDDEALAKVAAELGGAERAIGVSGDLSDAGIETCLVAAAVARYGRLDGALVVPDTPAPGPVLDTGDGDWRLGLEEQVLGPLRLCRAVIKNVTSGGRLARPRAVHRGPGARGRARARRRAAAGSRHERQGTRGRAGPARRARQHPAGRGGWTPTCPAARPNRAGRRTTAPGPRPLRR